MLNNNAAFLNNRLKNATCKHSLKICVWRKLLFVESVAPSTGTTGIDFNKCSETFFLDPNSINSDAFLLQYTSETWKCYLTSYLHC